MKRFYKIFIKNFISILLPALICVLITGSVFGRYYYTQTLNKTVSAMESTLYQTRDVLEGWLNHINTIVIELSYDGNTYYELRNLLEKPYLNNFDKRTLASKTSTMNAILSANKELKSVYMYIPNELGNFYASGETTMVNASTFYDMDWLAEYEKMSNKQAVTVFFHDVQRFSFEGKRNTLSVIRAFPAHSGAVVMNIDVGSIDAYFHTLNLPSGSMFVLRDSESDLYSYGAVGDRELMNYSVSISSSAYPWVYVMYISDIDLKIQKHTTLLYIMTPCLIAVVMGLISATYLTTKRHKKLKEIATTFESESINITEEDLLSNDEYGYISANLAKLLLEMDKRKYEAEILQLEAAQYQLTPHFLFNTLESIYFECMDLTGGENEASKMLAKLSAILKYSLRFPNEQVTVEKEAEIARLYSEIMKARDPGKFEVSFFIEPDCNDLTLPKLFLQPLIENSIYHGAKEKLGFTDIIVLISRYNDYLRISIADNGVGMDEADIIEVNTSMRENPRKHIGLGNIYRRLTTLYHDDFSMELMKNETGGIKVFIVIPAIRNSND